MTELLHLLAAGPAMGLLQPGHQHSTGALATSGSWRQLCGTCQDQLCR